MKNFQKTLNVFVLALLLIGVSTLGGCELEQNNVTNIAVSSETLQLEHEVKQIDPAIIDELQWLMKNGFIPSEEYDARLQVILSKESSDLMMEDGYFVAPDYFYTRAMVQDMMKQNVSHRQARHRRNIYMSNGGAITVRLQSALPPVWKTATIDAIAAWNSLGYNIIFAGVTASNNTNINGQIDVAYLTSTQLNLPTDLATVVFASTIPVASAGGVGEVIGINQTMDVSLNKASTASARKMIIVHELGHALGLKHTDSLEGIDIPPSVTCGGISGYTDPSSIMRNGFTSTQAWTGFTPCDKTVIDYYWGNIA